MCCFGVTVTCASKTKLRRQAPVGSSLILTKLSSFTVAPVIINNYFPIVSGGPVVTARDMVYTREILVRDTAPSNVPINDETLLNSAANVACKADGLPRPFIEWSATEAGSSVVVSINESRVTVPRAGRSIYNVDVISDTPGVVYQCTATNVDEGIGQVQVTPVCESL